MTRINLAMSMMLVMANHAGCLTPVKYVKREPETTGAETTSATTGADPCGNGELDDGEQCDDGNRDDYDACTAACRVAVCGDGIHQTEVEDCDEGEFNADDGTCTPVCTVAECGDGFVQAELEECDDGSPLFSNTECTDACFVQCTAGYAQCKPGEMYTKGCLCAP